MSEPTKDKIREHKADGIEEYDNPMPRWWVGLFYVTILFAVGYMAYLHLLGGTTLNQELKADLAAAQAQKQEAAGPSPTPGAPAEDLSKKFKDANLIAEGKDVFTTNCAPCHGQQGEGVVGPNLTDDHWIHGCTDADILRTITQGVPDKGMIAWGPILGPKKIDAVTAYVLSLHGTNPPNPKAPQGEVCKR